MPNRQLVLQVLERISRNTGTTTAIIACNATIGGMGDRVIHKRRIVAAAADFPLRLVIEPSPVAASCEAGVDARDALPRMQLFTRDQVFLNKCLDDAVQGWLC